MEKLDCSTPGSNFTHVTLRLSHGLLPGVKSLYLASISNGVVIRRIAQFQPGQHLLAVAIPAIVAANLPSIGRGLFPAAYVWSPSQTCKYIEQTIIIVGLHGWGGRVFGQKMCVERSVEQGLERRSEWSGRLKKRDRIRSRKNHLSAPMAALSHT